MPFHKYSGLIKSQIAVQMRKLINIQQSIFKHWGWSKSFHRKWKYPYKLNWFVLGFRAVLSFSPSNFQPLKIFGKLLSLYTANLSLCNYDQQYSLSYFSALLLLLRVVVNLRGHFSVCLVISDVSNIYN